MHTPAAQLDEEEDVQSSEPERLDREEVARDHRLRLRPEELAPAEPSPVPGGRHPGLPQDRTHRRRADLHPHTGQLTDDPLIPPAWVLTGNPQNELADVRGDRGPAGTAPRVRPASPNKPAMSVSGQTKNDCWPVPRRSRLAAARKTRSASSRRGRPICRRRTASSCRSTTISSSLNSPERKRSAATPRTRRNNRYTSDTSKGRLPPPGCGRPDSTVAKSPPTRPRVARRIYAPHTQSSAGSPSR